MLKTDLIAAAFGLVLFAGPSARAVPSIVSRSATFTTERSPIEQVYWYHVRYYPYSWRGHYYNYHWNGRYYNHRRWYGGRWHYW
jgi:hypothetical protein